MTTETETSRPETVEGFHAKFLREALRRRANDLRRDYDRILSVTRVCGLILPAVRVHEPERG